MKRIIVGYKVVEYDAPHYAKCEGWCIVDGNTLTMRSLVRGLGRFDLDIKCFDSVVSYMIGQGVDFSWSYVEVQSTTSTIKECLGMTKLVCECGVGAANFKLIKDDKPEALFILPAKTTEELFDRSPQINRSSRLEYCNEDAFAKLDLGYPEREKCSGYNRGNREEGIAEPRLWEWGATDPNKEDIWHIR